MIDAALPVPAPDDARGTGSLTPRVIVSELDRYIVGQRDAKRAVAIALRNRWRRMQVGDVMREEILPNNIILIGSTGGRPLREDRSHEVHRAGLRRSRRRFHDP